MKVFIVHKDIYDAGNPYIYTLKESIEKNHPDITFAWGEDIFWSEKILEYDIIHFHWPAAFLDCDAHHHSLEDFSVQLKKIKDHGNKIVSTCHDLCPHYTQGASFADAITMVYKYSNAIFHLGEYSQHLFMETFPQSNHYILPHHIYDEVYTIRPTYEVARKKLGLSPSKKYILCMGAFRAQEERDVILYLSKKLKHKDVEFIAPAFAGVRTSLKKEFPFVSKSYFHYLYYRYVRRIHLTGKTWVPISDEDLPYYYAACDMAFVQRLKILNSGNAVMPLLFNKPVCGPDIGNVGSFLKEYGGYVFNVEDIANLPQIIEKILLSPNPQKKLAIHAKVYEQLSTNVIAQKQYDYYCQILQN